MELSPTKLHKDMHFGGLQLHLKIRWKIFWTISCPRRSLDFVNNLALYHSIETRGTAIKQIVNKLKHVYSDSSIKYCLTVTAHHTISQLKKPNSTYLAHDKSTTVLTDLRGDSFLGRIVTCGMCF